MTPKQQRFCEEYLIDLNATQAAIRAGYSKKTASSQGERLLRNAEIKKVIAAGKANLAERSEVSAGWVLKNLKKEATRTGRGSSHGARVTALTQLGKHVGLFEDTLNLKGQLDMGRPFANLTDAELDRRIIEAERGTKAARS